MPLLELPTSAFLDGQDFGRTVLAVGAQALAGVGSTIGVVGFQVQGIEPVAVFVEAVPQHVVDKQHEQVQGIARPVVEHDFAQQVVVVAVVQHVAD